MQHHNYTSEFSSNSLKNSYFCEKVSIPKYVTADNSAYVLEMTTLIENDAFTLSN